MDLDAALARVNRDLAAVAEVKAKLDHIHQVLGPLVEKLEPLLRKLPAIDSALDLRDKLAPLLDHVDTLTTMAKEFKDHLAQLEAQKTATAAAPPA